MVVEEQQYKSTTPQHSLVYLCICIKGLLSHKMVLHSLLLVALFGPCGVCDGGQRIKNVIWFKWIVEPLCCHLLTLMYFQTCMAFLCVKYKNKNSKDCNYKGNGIFQASKGMQMDHKNIIKVVRLCFYTQSYFTFIMYGQDILV